VAFTKLGTEPAKVDPAKRALTFAFNGGPGSASIWLHMGALGPKRVGMKANGESLPPPDPRAEICRIRCFCRPPPRARGITTSAVAPWRWGDLRTALTAAEKLVQDKDAPALMRGDAGPAEEKAALAQEIAALPGMPEAFVLQRNLRNEIATFATQLLEAQDGSGGRFDCRLTGIRYPPGRAPDRSSIRATKRCWATTRRVSTTTCAAS
jgi:hypothetical protein